MCIYIILYANVICHCRVYVYINFDIHRKILSKSIYGILGFGFDSWPLN